MIKSVIKRDGIEVPFDANRIITAIMKAQESLGKSDFKQASDIANFIGKVYNETMHITEIQEIVETLLMEKDYDVAQSYTAYRNIRDKAREANSKLIRDVKAIISNSSQVSKENANKDSKVFPVQRDLLAGVISKHIARNHILPQEIVNAHDNGDIHFHDLDYSPFLPMTNCCNVDLTKLLAEGFRLGNAQIESPKSFAVACAVTAQIIAQVACLQYGGTSLANIDCVLAPYAAKSFDKHLKFFERHLGEVAKAYDLAVETTIKEINDGIQGLEYEINTLYTTNGQTPFVTLTFGMGVGPFEREIQKAILNVRIRGLGKNGITPVFPKLVMFMEAGINLKKEDPNYDIKQLALECSSKRLYPDIISAKNNRAITGNPFPVSPMGCRSFLGHWDDGSGVARIDGRSNIGVVSINLPRVALRAIDSHRRMADSSPGLFNIFWGILGTQLDVCHRALLCRVDSFRGVKASVAPFLYQEGAFGVNLKPDDDIIDLFKNGRSSISLGYIGLHETLKVLFNDEPFDNPMAQACGKNIIKVMKSATEKWSIESEEGFAFSLYSTPAESLCGKFCRLDKERFGDIPGITDKGWYTNSFHLDVEKDVSVFEKIDFEKDYHGIASGGHITFCEFPNMRHNLAALETVWDYAMEHLDYFGTNLPSDKCFECGFEGEFECTSRGFRCPHCGNNDSTKMNVIRRVCGYLGAPMARGFNDAKQAEASNRIKHELSPDHSG